MNIELNDENNESKRDASNGEDFTLGEGVTDKQIQQQAGAIKTRIEKQDGFYQTKNSTEETKAKVDVVINDPNRQTELNLPSKEGVDKSVERITFASPQP